MSKIEEWVGEYDVNYTNGFKTKYTISSDGKVSGTNLPNDGWKGGGILSLRTNKHEKCPAYPCAWLAGVHSKDKDEYMALKDGDLHINHYIKGKLCCTGLGKRIGESGGDKLIDVKVGASNKTLGGSKTVSLAVSCPTFLLDPSKKTNEQYPTAVKNTQDPNWGDRFKLDVKDKNLTVTRSDTDGWWGQDLILVAKDDGKGCGGGACKSRKEFISKTSGRCWCKTADGKNIDGRYSSSDSRRLAQGGWATSHQDLGKLNKNYGTSVQFTAGHEKCNEFCASQPECSSSDYENLPEMGCGCAAVESGPFKGRQYCGLEWWYGKDDYKSGGKDYGTGPWIKERSGCGKGCEKKEILGYVGCVESEAPPPPPPPPPNKEID